MCGYIFLLMRILDGFQKGFRRGDSVHSLKKRKLRMTAEGIRKQPGFIVFIEKV